MVWRGNYPPYTGLEKWRYTEKEEKRKGYKNTEWEKQNDKEMQACVLLVLRLLWLTTVSPIFTSYSSIQQVYIFVIWKSENVQILSTFA